MIKQLLAVCIGIGFAAAVSAQPGVAISAAPAVPHPAAMLDITSTSKGLLIPRLSTTQRTAISSVPDGLVVYDSTIKKFMYYNAAAASWQLLGSDTLQIPFRKTFAQSTGGGSGYTPLAALFSLTNNGSNPAALFRQQQTGTTRGNALYAEYDAANFATGYNAAFSAYGMRGRYTVGIAAYSDSTAAMTAYNIYRGTAIMAQNSVNAGGGPFAGIASGIFNSNKTLEGFACGIYQDGIASSPLVFSFANAAIAGYSESGAGGKFFGTDTAIHAIGNTYLMGNLRIADGTQGNGKILRSDGAGNAGWAGNLKNGVLTIPAAAFTALSGNGTSADYSLDAGESSVFNDITITNTTTNAALVAPVQLPNDALVTGMTFYVYDNNTTIGLKAELIAVPNDGLGTASFYAINTGAAFANVIFYNSFTSPGALTTINNNTTSYMVKIYPVDAAGVLTNWGPSLYIKAVKFNYSYAPL